MFRVCIYIYVCIATITICLYLSTVEIPMWLAGAVRLVWFSPWFSWGWLSFLRLSWAVCFLDVAAWFAAAVAAAAAAADLRVLSTWGQFTYVTVRANDCAFCCGSTAGNMAWLVVWRVVLLSLHFGGYSSLGVRWVHSCNLWLGCLERSVVQWFRLCFGWLAPRGGWFGFFLLLFWGFGVVVVSAALFWAAASLLRSAAGAVFCSPALMRCLLGGSSWIKWWCRLQVTGVFCNTAIAAWLHWDYGLKGKNCSVT